MPAVRYDMSAGFLELLAAHDITLAVTSYQSGRLYLLSRNPAGGLMVNEQQFKRAMGLFVQDGCVHLATRDSVQRLENILRPNERMDAVFSACFYPRTIHVTGDLHIHDIGVKSDGSIVFVNTRYNCLAALSEKHSFAAIWQPDFVRVLDDGDRCHLNGLAMHGGRPAFVTAVSRSDEVDGWRQNRTDGGLVIDVTTNEIVCENLSMPHSPRMHGDTLWLLNSGKGELGFVKPTGKGPGVFEPVAYCPGFLRGLAFFGDYAFVGLSKPRSERFEGLPLDDRLRKSGEQPKCAVQVIDLKSGECREWFSIEGMVSELFDVAVLEGVGCARSVSPFSDDVLGIITKE